MMSTTICMLGGNNGPKRRAQKGVTAYKGRMHTYDDDMVCGTSGRNGHVAVQEG